MKKVVLVGQRTTSSCVNVRKFSHGVRDESNFQLQKNFKGMKITRIATYQVDLPLWEGSYNWSGGKSVSVFDATVVQIDTDAGISGFGENTPLGPCYLPAYANGTRAGIRELAPSLLGQDPTRLNHINGVMDGALKGHPYVKSALDMACWDILGKVSGLSACELMGGRFDEDILLYRAISQESPEKMAQKVDQYWNEGYRKFQLKVGGNPFDDIERIHAVRSLLDDKQKLDGIPIPLFCDANTGWLRHEAMNVVNAVKNLHHTYIEQPCLTYDENVSVRRHCPLPFIIDENIEDAANDKPHQMAFQLIKDQAADAINLKIGKVGGLTKAVQVRDIFVAAGIAMNIEDSWGGDIVTAAIAHLAQSTPPHHRLCSTDFNSYGPMEGKMAKTTAHRVKGRLVAPSEPGLGVEPCFENLGEPIFDSKRDLKLN